MPPAIKNQPKLPSHLIPYLDAYYSLGRHRTRYESGVNPIGYSDLVTYAQTHGFMADQETFGRFELLVEACDSEFLSYVAEERQKEINRINAQSKN